jgi:hypothetical protein
VLIPEWPEYMDYDTSRKYLDDTLGIPVSAMNCESPAPVFVRVDEAQTTKTDRFFGNMFLKCYYVYGGTSTNIFVVMASAYGSTGRTAFDQPN